jgi:hypothetical protein
VITASPSGGPRWLLTDWLELEALCSKTASTSVHALNEDPSIEPDEQPSDIDEDGLREDERISRVTAEVEVRVRALGSSYPFRMTADGSRLECPPTSGVGATVYLFCLLASHGRAGGFLNQSDVVPISDVPDLLQACATWSAAGYEQGPAYALGLDPSAAAFLPKLAQIYAALKDGTPVTAIPNGAPAHVKDDGIDVIAWKHTGHAKPPATYLMGQVASRRNWDGKSLKHTIDRFHNTWFAPAPAVTAKPAIMIPFCIEGTPDDDDDLEQEALAIQWRRFISEFGELFYRYTMPAFAERGLQLHGNGVYVDMADWLSRLQDFVSGVIAKLQAECA